MPPVKLTIGKLRGLGQCATRRGAFSVLALDHRNNLRQLLFPDAPDSVPSDELVTFKQQVIGALAPAASAVLLDPEFGAAQCIASGALPGNVGLLVATEATGYTGDPAARQHMERITALCDALARPWMDFCSAPDIQPNWYERYDG